jgi:hypothetical protein
MKGARGILTVLLTDAARAMGPGPKVGRGTCTHR